MRMLGIKMRYGTQPHTVPIQVIAREYYGEKENLSDFLKQRNANNENSGTIVTEASGKPIKVCLSQSY